MVPSIQSLYADIISTFGQILHRNEEARSLCICIIRHIDRTVLRAVLRRDNIGAFSCLSAVADREVVTHLVSRRMIVLSSVPLDEQAFGCLCCTQVGRSGRSGVGHTRDRKPLKADRTEDTRCVCPHIHDLSTTVAEITEITVTRQETLRAHGTGCTHVIGVEAVFFVCGISYRDYILVPVVVYIADHEMAIRVFAGYIAVVYYIIALGEQLRSRE